MRITKLEAARRQLVTGIRLFFEDADSISVYTLGHAAWEVLDALCKHQGKIRFREQMAGANRGPTTCSPASPHSTGSARKREGFKRWYRLRATANS
jgi:hypothetical protein